MQESKKAFSQPNKEEKTPEMPNHGQHHETKGTRDEKNNPEQEDEETEEEKEHRTTAQHKQPAKGSNPTGSSRKPNAEQTDAHHNGEGVKKHSPQKK